MVTAVSEHSLHFNLLHRKDSSPIGYEKVCKKEGKQVPDDEIVKAYETSKGKYVEIEDEDFEAARAEGYRTFDISDFVAVAEIDPIYFERSYYLLPQEGGEKVYALLVRAMEDAGLAAVGTTGKMARGIAERVPGRAVFLVVYRTELPWVSGKNWA